MARKIRHYLTGQAELRRVLDRQPATLSELARAAKMAPSTLSRAYSGTGKLSPTAARRVLKVLRRWATLYGQLADEFEIAVGRLEA